MYGSKREQMENTIIENIGSEIPNECRFTTYEMTQYILRALAFTNASKVSNRMTFKMYGYGGSINDLFSIVDDLATLDGKIEKAISLPKSAWGIGWNGRNPGMDTNFNYEEINLFMESVYYLLNQQIIGPGNARGISANLPWVHVTAYGRKCMEFQDILPYDADGYLDRVKNCSQNDAWDVYYISQVLKCFNNGLYDAATMMLGIESEYLTCRLIENYEAFLTKNEPQEKIAIEKELKTCQGKISKKYTAYYKSLNEIKGKKDASNQIVYPYLKALSPKMDDAANASFMNYLRLTRNELAHPSSVKMDPTETMLLIVAFLKYYKIQNEFLDYYVKNS